MLNNVAVLPVDHAIDRSNFALEERVQERTAELT